MLPRQVGGGLPHPLHIRRVGQQRHILPVEHRLDLPHKHRVAVGLAQRVVPGVEPGPTGLHLPDGDGIRQIAVAVVPDLLRGFLHVQLGVGHHGTGVNACIGAACADDLHRLAGQTAQHRFELALNGVPVRLALPAEKPCAVIGNGKFIVLHHHFSFLIKQRRRLCCSMSKSFHWDCTFSLVSSMGPVSASLMPSLKQPCMALYRIMALTPFFW